MGLLSSIVAINRLFVCESKWHPDWHQSLNIFLCFIQDVTTPQSSPIKCQHSCCCITQRRSDWQVWIKHPVCHPDGLYAETEADTWQALWTCQLPGLYTFRSECRKTHRSSFGLQHNFLFYQFIFQHVTDYQMMILNVKSWLNFAFLTFK